MRSSNMSESFLSLSITSRAHSPEYVYPEDDSSPEIREHNSTESHSEPPDHGSQSWESDELPAETIRPSVVRKRIQRVCHKYALLKALEDKKFSKKRKRSKQPQKRAKRLRSRPSDVVRENDLELFEIIPMDDPFAGKARQSPSDESSDNLWFSKRVLNFDPVSLYSKSQKSFFVVNETKTPVTFQCLVIGDPRATGNFPGKTEQVKVPTYTEILQEKPYFTQANMCFDPSTYSAGPAPVNNDVLSGKAWIKSLEGLKRSGFTDANPAEQYQAAVASFFSVFPSCGTLKPYQPIRIDVDFVPWFMTTAHAQLIVSLPGTGVARSVYLIGRCARQNVVVKPSVLNFGDCFYDVVQERPFEILNHGRYPVQFCVTSAVPLSKERLVHPECETVYVSSTKGEVMPHGKIVITVFYLPGKPGKFERKFFVEVTDEPGVTVKVVGRGIFNTVRVNLPKEKAVTGVKRGCDNGNLLAPEATASETSGLKRWAKSSQKKAGKSNIKLKPDVGTIQSGAYRPFKGILDFSRLSDYVLDFGLLSPSDPDVTYEITVTNPGDSGITFGLLQTHEELRNKIRVVFNRHLELKPRGTTKIRFVLSPANYAVGPSQCQIPFQIRNGPMFRVIVRAEVREPVLDVRLRCSEKDHPTTGLLCRVPRNSTLTGSGDPGDTTTAIPRVQFGTVRCGFCSIVYLQIINPGHVLAKWGAAPKDIDFPEVSKKLNPKDRQELWDLRRKQRIFRLIPKSGTLEPGAKTNLELRFSPVYDGIFNFVWLISVDFSRQKLLLPVQGTGQRPGLVFSHKTVQFEPVFPFSGGQEKVVTVCNPCSFPVEFFCLDLDEKYVKETEILRKVEELDQEKSVLFPVRKTGAGLPEELVEAYGAAKHPQSGEGRNVEPMENQALIAMGYGGLGSRDKDVYGSDEDIRRDLKTDFESPLAKANARYRGENGAGVAKPDEFRKGAVFLVHGPPACGKTTLATSLSKLYRIPVLTLDHIIKEAIESPSDPVHRRILNFLMSPAAPSSQSHPGTARSLQTPPGSSFPGSKTRDKPKPPPTGKPQSKLAKAQAHKAQLLAADPLGQRDRSDPDLQYQSKTVKFKNTLTDDVVELVTSVLPEDMMIALLNWRLQQSDCRRGAVFDGVQSDFVDSFPAAGKMLLQASGPRKRIYSFVICNSFRDYWKRQKKHRTKRTSAEYADIIREMAKIRSMTEQEYSSLLPAARKRVDTIVRQYATATRALHKRRGPLRAVKALPKVLPVEPVKEPPPTGGKGQKTTAASTHKMVAAPKDHDLEPKVMPSKSNADNTSQSAMRSSTRNQTAKHSVLKLKGKSTESSAKGRGSDRDASSSRIRRDAWSMALKPLPDGQPSNIYKSDMYKRHKTFYATLKDYTHVITKWTAAGKIETLRKINRPDASPNPMPTTAKVRGKRDTKSKPKEKTEAERKERDKAAIDRAKARCRRKRGFGVKHIVIVRKNTKNGDNRLVQLKKDQERWSFLPPFDLLEKATQARVTIPKPMLYTVVKRPSVGHRPSDTSQAPQFQFVTAADDPSPGSAPSPTLSVQISRSRLNSMSPDRSTADGRSTPEKNSEARGSLKQSNLKPDPKKKVKSAYKGGRAIGSAMTREGHYTGEKEGKTTTPTDPSMIYPGYNKAKAMSETKTRPLTSFRWALPAYGKLTLSLLFRSDTESVFQSVYKFGVVDYPDWEFELALRGSCKYPNLFRNLQSIFPPKIRVDEVVDERVGPVYVEKEKKLYFGPVLAGKKKADVLSDHANPHQTFLFPFRNPYRKAFNVHFSIAKRQGSNPKDRVVSPDFSVVPDRLTIQPGEEKFVKFYAHPVTPGKTEDFIYAFTEYNPVPLQILLSCIAVKPQAELVTKSVVIDKIPIRETGVGNVEVRNKSLLLPIKWRLLGTEIMPPEFVFEQKEGLLKATTEVQYIPVKYVSTSEKPVSHSKKPFRIEFLTDDPDSNVVQTENVVVSGESYDLMLDISFPKAQESVLDFGVCKINEEVIRQMVVKNRSKSDCGFHFFAHLDELKQKHPLDQLKALLDFQPASGLITSSDRPLTINVVCKPKFEVEFKLEKVVRCLVLDPARAFQRVAEIPIKTTLIASYSKFVLAPVPGDLRFMCSLPMQKRARTITLQNVGLFDLSYIVKKQSVQQQPSANPAAVASSSGNPKLVPSNAKSPVTAKPSTTSTHSNKKQDPSGLGGFQGGPFLVKPASGTVKVNETAQIAIEFGSDLVGNHTETYTFEISDRNPTLYPRGIIYSVSGEIAVPNLDVKNLEVVFVEHMVLPSEMTVAPPESLTKWLLDRSVYFPKTRQLVVQHTFVGSKRKLTFRLSNPSNIVCPVAFGLRTGSNQPVKINSKTPVDGFSIAPGFPSTVDPHQTGVVSVIFAPIFATRYQATFDVLIETLFGNPAKTIAFSFDITAEGTLPSIKILQPTFKDRRKQLSLIFPKIPIGTTETLPVVLSNETPMPVTLSAKVRGTDGIYKVYPENAGSGDATENIEFAPKTEKTFLVQFSPVSPGKIRRLLEFSCLEYVCPDLGILLKAEGVTGEMEIQGLPVVDYQSRLRLLAGTSPQYEDILMDRFQLPFWDCKPGQNFTYKIQLVNTSKEWARFEWPKLGDFLILSPRIGHMKPQSSLFISVSYRALEETKTQILSVSCTLNCLIIPEVYDVENPWNSDRMAPKVYSTENQDGASGLRDAVSLEKEAEKESDHSVKDGKHEKTAHKKGTAKLRADKKPAKKESLIDKHRKTTVDEKVQRRKSDQKKEKTPTGEKGASNVRVNSASDDGKTGNSSPEIKEEIVIVDGQQRILTSTPEPLCTIKPFAQGHVNLVVSSISGFAKWECGVVELLFKDTFILERRTMTFPLKNSGNVILKYSAAFSTSPEQCFAALELQNAAKAAPPVEKVKTTRDSGKAKEPSPATLAPAQSTRGDKGAKSAKQRGGDHPASEGATQVKDSQASAKKKRRESKDTAGSNDTKDKAPDVQSGPPPTGKSGKDQPYVRKIEAAMFRSLGVNQTASLAKAFAITSKTGEILPGTTEKIVVEFSPEEVMDLLGCLFFTIENSDQKGPPLVIPVHGTGKLPVIHLSATRGEGLKLGEISGQEGRVLEFVAVGTDRPVTKDLVMTNPTDEFYEVDVLCLDPSDANKPPFEASKSHVTVAAGKRSIVPITFLPYMLGKTESKWSVDIPTLNVSVPLTLTALTRDAQVTLNPPVLQFGPLFPNMRSEKFLKLSNEEDLPLSFEFNTENFLGHETAKWEISPLKGVLKPKSSQAILVTFVTTENMKVDIPLVCKVERRSTSLRSIVSHQVISPTIELVYHSEGEKIPVLQESNFVADFGTCEALAEYTRTLQLTNTGIASVAYVIKLLQKDKDVDKGFFQVSPKQGLVSPAKNQTVTLTYSPRKAKDKLVGLSLVLEVEFGKRYVMDLTSFLYTIDIDFSFDDCDFGPHLIAKDCPGLGSTVPLIIANKTPKPVSLDLISHTLPSCMALEFLPLTLQLGHSTIHTVMFLPTEAGVFSGNLTFLMNASVTKTLTLQGEGVPLIVEVPAKMRHLQFKKAAVGKRNVEKFEIQNRSKTEVTGHLEILPRGKAKDAVDILQKLIKDGTFATTLDRDVTIPAASKFDAEIILSSAVRVPQFEARIVFVTEQKVTRELATVTAFLPGVDVVLEEAIIDFSSLVLTGTLTRNVVLRNRGETGATFSWDEDRLAPHFTITPATGFIAAKADTVLQITFAPQNLNPDIRIPDIPCHIPENRARVSLTLIGACIPLPPAKDTVTFECPVRQTDTKMLSVTNSSPNPWELRPRLQGSDQWTVASTVQVKPNSTEYYEAVFRPLRMSQHQGSVSIILPTGQAVVTNLIGKTYPPKAAGKIVRDVPCRVEWKEKLLVSNWLPTTQSFRVLHDYVKPDKSDPAIELGGKSLVHLPGLTNMEYEFTFKALRDKDVNMVYTYRIVFKAEETGEYQYYDVQYKVIKKPTNDTKVISGTVRTLKKDSVRIKNPLETQVTVAAALQGGPADLTMEPFGTAVVQPGKDVEVWLEYFPLKVGTSQARLDVGSPELGLFSIEITLQATPSPPEPPVIFETPLGTPITQICKIYNYSKNKADFAVKIVDGAAEFQLAGEKSTFSLPPGTSLNPTSQTVEIQFDPVQLGESTGKLVALSAAAGEFQIPLIGKSVQPKPKGPFAVASDGEITPPLSFRNPFARACVFSLSVSNKMFEVSEVTEAVKPKKTTTIQVGLNSGLLDAAPIHGTPVFATLTVTPKFEGPVAEEEQCIWTYCLKTEL